MTRNSNPTNQQLVRTLTLDRSTINEDERTVELSFSSEAPYERYFGAEILSHDPDAIDLTRLQEVGVLLFAHGRDARYGRMPIGSIEKVWLDQSQRKLRAKVKFDDDEESDRVFQKVKKGYIKGVSVGYSVSSWEEVKAGKTSANGRHSGPSYIALKWQPFEISIEPIPADPSVGVGRNFGYESEEFDMNGLKRLALQAQGFHVPDMGTNLGGGGGAPATEPGTRTTEQPAAPPIDTAELQRRAAEAERARVTEISQLCRTFGLDDAEYIRSGAPVQAVKDAILQKQMEERKPHTTSVEVRTEEVEKFRAAASDALLLRAGRHIQKPADGALELRSLRLRDLAIDCLQRAGEHQAHRMKDEDLLKRALMPDSTFQGIISNAVNKTLSQAYQEAPTTFQLWTSKGSNSDFKAAEHYRISEAGNLELTPQNGLIPYDTPMKDEKVTKAVLTYTKRWGFTREAFVNDDLGILTRVPTAYVTAAKRGINQLVYKMLATNPVIFDANPLFDAVHNNLGTAGAIGKDTMSEARLKMRTQKDQRGIATLNISPRYLLVPAALETAAAQFMRSEADLTSNNSGVANVFRNSYTVIVDAELDAYSGDAWYLAADQNLADTIEVTYLRGQEEPTLETDIPFDRLGMDFRIYFDYGVTVLDYRGLFKNDGVAVTP
ncbi:peptidase [Brevibacillus panacihumi]|uniref:Peptidase n=2 Tax=Brevibacillus panacihumi TaxID=497735 RepID=A0A3M8C930_9BACL|nr:peptidase [Brevibacillus panacihumi]